MSASSVAAALAVLPTEGNAPRVIQQFTSVFLVSSGGELWRVFDADDPRSAARQMPSSFSTRRYRIFVALARGAQVKVHRFDDAAPHDVDPVSLQAQLEAST